MDAAEKQCVAEQLDAHVRTLRLTGLDDVALFAAMSDRMPAFRMGRGSR